MSSLELRKYTVGTQLCVKSQMLEVSRKHAAPIEKEESYFFQGGAERFDALYPWSVMRLRCTLASGELQGCLW